MCISDSRFFRKVSFHFGRFEKKFIRSMLKYFESPVLFWNLYSFSLIYCVLEMPRPSEFSAFIGTFYTTVHFNIPVPGKMVTLTSI